MGYTNYWEQVRDFSQVEWDNVEADCAYLQDLGYDCEIETTGADTKVFRLYGECETFSLHKKRRTKEEYEGQNLSFYFCKTRMKPYDLAVKYMLGQVAQNLGEDFTYWSD